MKRAAFILSLVLCLLGCQLVSDYVSHHGIPEWTHKVPVVKQAVENTF